MILLILMMMKNNNIISALISTFSSIFISLYSVFKYLFIYVFGVLFSLLAAIFDFTKYFSNLFSYASKSTYNYNTSFFNQFEYFVFPVFFSYYNILSTHFKKVLYFLSFIIPYFLILKVELSNESLLLGCIIFTIFLLYDSAKDFMISSIASDVNSVKALAEKKLDLLSKIYALESSMVEEQLGLISSMEECVSKLSIFEQTSSEVDSTIFENMLNTTFSESLFDYYVIELQDDFYKEYFFIEENFEEAANRFIEENF